MAKLYKSCRTLSCRLTCRASANQRPLLKVVLPSHARHDRQVVYRFLGRHSRRVCRHVASLGVGEASVDEIADGVSKRLSGRYGHLTLG